MTLRKTTMIRGRGKINANKRIVGILIKKLESHGDIALGKSKWTRQTAFYFLGKEIAHFHNDKQLDIRITRKYQRQYPELIGFDSRIRRRGTSEWVTFDIASEQDVTAVVTLVKLAREANLAERKAKNASENK